MRYKGIDIVIRKEAKDCYVSGFPKNPDLYQGHSEEQALDMIKSHIDDMPEAIIRCYQKFGKTMRELEDL